MKNFFSGSTAGKFMIFSLGFALLPVFALGGISYFLMSSSLEKAAFNQLDIVNELKHEEVEAYFKNREGDANVLARSDAVRIAFDKLRKYHDDGGATPSGSFDVKSKRYQKIYGELFPFFKMYAETFGYDNVYFLCATHGHVMFAEKKKADLGTSLTTGAYKGSALSRLWAKVVKDKRLVYEDFSNYAPNGAPAMFMGLPVYDGGGNFIAVIALQLKSKAINAMVHVHAGMGKTGEVYLVGSDLLMRTNSRFAKDSTTLKTKVDTISVRKALAGKPGNMTIEDYRGVSVLSSYMPLTIGDIHWAIVSEIDASEAFAPIGELSNWIIILGVIIASISVIFAYFISRKQADPILRMAEFASRIGKNDLTVPVVDIKRKDEVGKLNDALIEMKNGLLRSINAVKDSMFTITSSSSQIASSSLEQAGGAMEQASAITEASSTVEELAKSAEQIADNAQAVSASSDLAYSSILEVQEIVSDMAKKILSLGEKGQSIGGIIGVIDGLTEQTNLLALNAAIEAARAGEAGKGFAVVAGEIRKLSERSSESTTEIRSLINEIQAETNAAVLGVEKSTDQVGKGLEMVKDSSRQVKEIKMATGQQRSAFEQVVMAIRNIDQVTKQFVDTSKEVTVAAEVLNKQSEKLKSLVGVFKLEGEHCKLK